MSAQYIALGSPEFIDVFEAALERRRNHVHEPGTTIFGNEYQGVCSCGWGAKSLNLDQEKAMSRAIDHANAINKVREDQDGCTAE